MAPRTWQPIRPAGRGGQAEVWLARADDGEVAALKILDKGRADRFDEELRKLMLLQHESVVRCRGATEVDGKPALILEWVDGEPLDVAAPRMSRDQARLVIVHLAHALAYVHGMHVVHRDVKPENVLILKEFWVDPSKPSAIKVVDFGIAVTSGNPRPKTVPGGHAGTPLYSAPEVLLGEGSSSAPAVDIFALGVVGWELLTGRHPLREQPRSGTAEERIRRLRQTYQAARDGAETWPVGDAGEDLTADAVRRCLSLDPRRRPTDGGAVATLLAGGAPERTATFVPAPSEMKTEPKPVERRGRAGVLVLIVLVLIALAVAGVALFASRSGGRSCAGVAGATVSPLPVRGRRAATVRTDPAGGRSDNALGDLSPGSVIFVLGQMKGPDHEQWLNFRVDCATGARDLPVGRIGWTHAINVPDALTVRRVRSDAPLTDQGGLTRLATVPAGASVWIVTPPDERGTGRVRVRVSEPEVMGWMRESDLR